MGLESFELAIVAVIPALLLMIYVFIKDRADKEPIGLLAGLLLAGAVAYIPAYFLKNAAMLASDKIFADYMTFSYDGIVEFTTNAAKSGHSIFASVIGVGLVEVGLKWLVLFFITGKNKNFNYLFDGIVYSVAVSMGFAAAENIWYSVANGWEMLLLRSLSTVPAHLLFGIVTGILYTIWHTYYLARRKEKALGEEGKLKVNKPINSAKWLVLSLIVPITLQSIFALGDKLILQGASLGFCVLSVVIYLVCFTLINRLSASDDKRDKTTNSILKKKYPWYIPENADN